MLYTLEIADGYGIDLKANAFSAILYKTQFKKDYFADLIKAVGGRDGLAVITNNNGNEKNLSEDDLMTVLENIDITIMYQMLWSYAKAANKNTPNFEVFIEKYADDLDLLSLLDVITTIGLSSLKSPKKLTAATASK